MGDESNGEGKVLLAVTIRHGGKASVESAVAYEDAARMLRDLADELDEQGGG